MTDQVNEKLLQILEAALMASHEPLTIKRMQGLFGDDKPDSGSVKQALQQLQSLCAERAYELKEVGSGWRFQVKEQYSEWVGRLWEEKPQRYTRALLETLALIAYRQPITRGEIEDVRGVSVSSNIIRTLEEREWVRVVGHRDVPGRPAMYATTRQFLDYFNLKSLEELPSLAALKNIDEIGQSAEQALTRALAKADMTLEEALQLHAAKEESEQEVNEEESASDDVEAVSAAELANDEVLSKDEQALAIHAQEES